MSQDELIQAVVEAIKHDGAARVAVREARENAEAAATALQLTWTALREHQDGLVAARLRSETGSEVA